MVPYLPVAFEQALPLTSPGVLLEGGRTICLPFYPLRPNEIFTFSPDSEMCQRYELIDLYQANLWILPLLKVSSFK